MRNAIKSFNKHKEMKLPQNNQKSLIIPTTTRMNIIKKQRVASKKLSDIQNYVLKFDEIWTFILQDSTQYFNIKSEDLNALIEHINKNIHYKHNIATFTTTMPELILKTAIDLIKELPESPKIQEFKIRNIFVSCILAHSSLSLEFTCFERPSFYTFDRTEDKKISIIKCFSGITQSILQDLSIDVPNNFTCNLQKIIQYISSNLTKERIISANEFTRKFFSIIKAGQSLPKSYNKANDDDIIVPQNLIRDHSDFNTLNNKGQDEVNNRHTCYYFPDHAVYHKYEIGNCNWLTTNISADGEYGKDHYYYSILDGLPQQCEQNEQMYIERSGIRRSTFTHHNDQVYLNTGINYTYDNKISSTSQINYSNFSEKDLSKYSTNNTEAATYNPNNDIQTTTPEKETVNTSNDNKASESDDPLSAALERAGYMLTENVLEMLDGHSDDNPNTSYDINQQFLNKASSPSYYTNTALKSYNNKIPDALLADIKTFQQKAIKYYRNFSIDPSVNPILRLMNSITLDDFVPNSSINAIIKAFHIPTTSFLSFRVWHMKCVGMMRNKMLLYSNVELDELNNVLIAKRAALEINDRNPATSLEMARQIRTGNYNFINQNVNNIEKIELDIISISKLVANKLYSNGNISNFDYIITYRNEIIDCVVDSIQKQIIQFNEDLKIAQMHLDTLSDLTDEYGLSFPKDFAEDYTTLFIKIAENLLFFIKAMKNPNPIERYKLQLESLELFFLNMKKIDESHGKLKALHEQHWNFFISCVPLTQEGHHNYRNRVIREIVESSSKECNDYKLRADAQCAERIYITYEMLLNISNKVLEICKNIGMQTNIGLT